MALASLILSFFSIIPPFGIAAAVLGHKSRSQIARSGGRLTGAWPAFAALVLGYLQLVVFALIFLAGLGLLLEFNQHLSKEPWIRAALVERLMNGDPHKVIKADAARHQQDALEALRLLRTRQHDYVARHPADGYACRLDQLGYQPTEESELRTFILNSRYRIQILNCWGTNQPRFVILAVPDSQFNPPDCPALCMDSTDIIYRYTTDQSADAIARVAGKDHELCPRSGERVE